MQELSTQSDILNAIRARRSLRRYQQQAIPESLIRTVLNAGIWAPSAHNRQPWRFAVLQSFESKEGLAQAMGQRLREDLQRDAVPEAIIRKEVDRSYDRLTAAPVVLVINLSMEDMDTYQDDRRNTNEYIMAVQSVAMAGQNILLAASSVGLAACWMCAPLFCPDVVRDHLQLPAEWHPQGIITMGYPAQERTKTRQPLETRILWR